jgi:chromosome segregation ATPase
MAEKVEIDIEVNSNLEPTIANLKALKKQLRETAAGSAEFNKISQQIRDMDDAIKDAAKTSDDFLGYLENASGPLGVLGKGIRQAEQTFSSFNAVLKASVIGIVVAAIGGLVAAFTKSETAMKKLQPLFIGLEKILGGIFRALEPVLDTFIELATDALPYVTKGIGIFYSSIVALFTYIKEAGTGVAKLWKGVFTLDYKSIEAGISQIGGSFSKVGEAYKDSMKRFEDGTKEVTKTEKEQLEERAKLAKEAEEKRKTDREKRLREQQEREAEALREEQQILDAQYQDFLNQQADQYRKLSFMSDMLRGGPLSQATEQRFTAPASPFAQVAGAGVTAMGLKSLMGKKEGGAIKSYANGGLVGIAIDNLARG